MSDSNAQPNSGKPYIVDECRQVTINGHRHDAWPIAHDPSNTGVVVVILPVSDRTRETVKERRETADRIAACLNACDGINPEAVPEFVKVLQTIDTMPVDGVSPYVIESMLRQAKSLAYAALAKAKEGVA